jgi:hypothetical protein
MGSNMEKELSTGTRFYFVRTFDLAPVPCLRASCYRWVSRLGAADVEEMVYEQVICALH